MENDLFNFQMELVVSFHKISRITLSSNERIYYAGFSGFVYLAVFSCAVQVFVFFSIFQFKKFEYVLLVDKMSHLVSTFTQLFRFFFFQNHNFCDSIFTLVSKVSIFFINQSIEEWKTQKHFPKISNQCCDEDVNNWTGIE